MRVDGFGNQLMMDGANVPILLALLYLGDVDVNDPIYQNTLFGELIIKLVKDGETDRLNSI